MGERIFSDGGLKTEPIICIYGVDYPNDEKILLARTPLELGIGWVRFQNKFGFLVWLKREMISSWFVGAEDCEMTQTMGYEDSLITAASLSRQWAIRHGWEFDISKINLGIREAKLNQPQFFRNGTPLPIGEELSAASDFSRMSMVGVTLSLPDIVRRQLKARKFRRKQLNDLF